jgi:hypothetical protein
MSAPGKLDDSDGLGNTAALRWKILDSFATYPNWHSEAIGERHTYRVACRDWNTGWCELLITEGGKYVISLSCNDLSVAMKAAQAYEARKADNADNADKALGYTLAGAGELPDPDLRPIRPGQLVKLLFIPDDGVAESMWVEVSAANPFGGFYRGSLMNTPMSFGGLEHGDEVRFRIENVIDIYLA